MPGNERDSTGKWAMKATTDDVLDVFDVVDGPVVSSSDVADVLDVSRPTAGRRLRDLEDAGVLDSRITGGSRVYWQTE